MGRFWKWLTATVVAAVVVTLCAGTGTALAAGFQQDRVVSPDTPPLTPWLLDGTVRDLAQVGDRIVAAGTFTQVQDAPENGGAAMAQPYVVAFDVATGRLDRAFDPQLNGEVRTVEPGPNGTVYLGGAFTTVNGQTVRRLVQVSLATGDRVGSFRTPAINGIVNDLALVGNRLFAGGNFTTVAGQPHGGLASFDATTGALTSYLGVDVAQNHNWPNPGTVRGAVGVENFDITPDGTRMIVIGNFRTADGLPRDQVAMLRLTATSATVDPNWRTTRYEAPCYYWAFDSYVRDVQFAPDGSYFAISGTGGANPGTLCDSLTRWETDSSGQDVQPTWAEFTGGDSLFSVEVTGSAIYTGGHERWMNNPLGRDYAGAGAVPRPGLAALDPRTGVPLAWNPGRHPRGVGAEALLATSDGLYVGQDTQYIGDREVRRPGLAFFPLAGGSTGPSEDTGSLPGDVYLGGSPDPVPAGQVFYRVNAGGPELPALDGGPVWSADDGPDNPLRTSGSTATSYGPVGSVDGSVPSSTPAAVFSDERASTGVPGTVSMSWAFPVPAGTTVDVRLYLANRDPATAGVGARLFSVLVEGALRTHFYDLFGDVGTDVGTMKSFTVTSDGTINLDFLSLIGPPVVDAIEIVAAPGPAPAGADDLAVRSFDGTTAGADQPGTPGGLEWSRVRGAFMAGDQLIYGYPAANGDYYLYQRSFDGTAFGPATALDPYNDPKWSDVATGTWWGTIPNPYRGLVPNFYSQLPTVSSMFFRDGVLYYTRAGFPGLYSRAFSLDSGIVAEQERVAVPTGFSDVAGAFLSGDRLYWATASTGELRSTAWNGGAPDAAASTAVPGTGTGGTSWAARALFIGPGSGPQNVPPTAALDASCTDLSCTFSSAGSSDSDGTIASYAWDFGDGQASTDANPVHEYAAPGDYHVSLTVTDDAGAGAVAEKTVTVEQVAPGAGIALRGAAGTSARSVSSVSVTVPGNVQAGDGLVLVLSTNSTVSGATPAGWMVAGSRVSGSGPTTQVFQKVAGAGDAGSTVTVALSGRAKVTLQLLAYSGTAAAGPVGGVTSAAQGAGTSHSTPAANAPAGYWVLSIWSDKQAAARSWTPPASGVTVRSNLAGVGKGDIATLVADSGAAVAGGAVGGLTATVPTASTRATTFTVLLAPAG